MVRIGASFFAVTAVLLGVTGALLPQVALTGSDDFSALVLASAFSLALPVLALYLISKSRSMAPRGRPGRVLAVAGSVVVVLSFVFSLMSVLGVLLYALSGGG